MSFWKKIVYKEGVANISWLLEKPDKSLSFENKGQVLFNFVYCQGGIDTAVGSKKGARPQFSYHYQTIETVDWGGQKS